MDEFRVFDTELNCFINDEILIGKNIDIFKVTQKTIGVFHKKVVDNIELLSNERYKVTYNTHAVDADGNFLYEGDIVSVDTGILKFNGIVIWNGDVCSYSILDKKENKYYDMIKDVMNKYVKVIGNIYNNKELLGESNE